MRDLDHIVKLLESLGYLLVEKSVCNGVERVSAPAVFISTGEGVLMKFVGQTE